jgi:catechol 2,3-dioxygenase-like lactoylglutathione lyase family enzyme
LAGEPSHFEVGVRDAVRAKAFYGELLGWSFRDHAGGRFTTCRHDQGVEFGLHQPE